MGWRKHVFFLHKRLIRRWCEGEKDGGGGEGRERRFRVWEESQMGVGERETGVLEGVDFVVAMV